MVHQRVVSLVDDLDGTPAQETVRFNIDGTDYEIDLSLAHATSFRQLLATYVNSARRVDTATPPQQDHNRAIRAWARRHGRDLHKRGRIPNDVIHAYHHSP